MVHKILILVIRRHFKLLDFKDVDWIKGGGFKMLTDKIKKKNKNRILIEIHTVKPVLMSFR